MVYVRVSSVLAVSLRAADAMQCRQSSQSGHEATDGAAETYITPAKARASVVSATASCADAAVEAKRRM